MLVREEEKNICINMYDNWYGGHRSKIFWRYLVQFYFFIVRSAEMMFIIVRVSITRVRIIESINNKVQSNQTRKIVLLRFNNLFEQVLRVMRILITHMMSKLSSSRRPLQNTSSSSYRLNLVRREHGNLYWLERKHLLLCFIFNLSRSYKWKVELYYVNWLKIHL